MNGIRTAVAATIIAAAVAHAASDTDRTLMLTLSGLPASPRGRRALDVGDAPAGIRFQAPASGALAAVHLAWQRPGSQCRVSLHPDGTSGPGAAIATADVPAGRGWTTSALSASLSEGAVYHLLVRCNPTSGARLAYVVDREGSAVATGAWQLEDTRGAQLGPLPSPASPLFVLTFADGTSWGNPYVARKAAMRVCRTAEVRVRITPASTMTVVGVDAPAGSALPAAQALRYSLETSDGSVLLAGIGPADAGETTLAAGTTYWLRLMAPTLRTRCLLLPGLRADVALGRPVDGFETTEVARSLDGGRHWMRQHLNGIGAGLRVRRRRRTTTTTLPPVVTPSTSTTTVLSGSTTTSTTTRASSTSSTSVATTSTTSSTSTASTSTTTSSTTVPSTTTTVSSSTTTTLATGAYRAPYADGYLGFYDPTTVPVWPQRMILMLGEADAQGPLIANAKTVAAAANNANAKFIFYLSLTEMDSRCNCFDQTFYDGWKSVHPEWILHDANGNPVTTANGIGRLFAVDIGNLAYADAWANYAFAAMDRYGWDGVFADSVIRGNFSGWSGAPINPRTGRPMTVPEYRAGMLAALQRLRALFDARGSILVGNHSSAWDPATFADPIVKQEITTMHGVELEDCVYDFNGVRQSEASWIAQLQYLDYANQAGVRTICNGPGGSIGDPTERWYVLASYLLTKEGLSSVAEINTLGTWWDGLGYDLGAPLGRYYCLDPAAGLAPTASCPSTGKIYGRDWQHGRVLVNPTSGTTVHVTLGETLLLRGSSVTSVDLSPGSGVVLVRP
jgi:hypothetical protein